MIIMMLMMQLLTINLHFETEFHFIFYLQSSKCNETEMLNFYILTTKTTYRSQYQLTYTCSCCCCCYCALQLCIANTISLMLALAFSFAWICLTVILLLLLCITNVFRGSLADRNETIILLRLI